VADVIDIRTGRPVRDLEAMLAKRGRPMTELEVVLVRFGTAIAEREKQRRASAFCGRQATVLREEILGAFITDSFIARNSNRARSLDGEGQA
jgi:hypothetical protein